MCWIVTWAGRWLWVFQSEEGHLPTKGVSLCLADWVPFTECECGIFLQVRSPGRLFPVSHSTMDTGKPLSKAQGGQDTEPTLWLSSWFFALGGWLVVDLLGCPHLLLSGLCSLVAHSLSWFNGGLDCWWTSWIACSFLPHLESSAHRIYFHPLSQRCR